MLKVLQQQFRPALVSLALLTLITGVVYPLLVTLLAQTFFARQSSGGMVQVDGKTVGSSLIGQTFSKPEYFWGRPSAASTEPYNGAISSGSNLGPTNRSLAQLVHDRVTSLSISIGSDSLGTSVSVPVDLVTASASGLDPDISPAAALYQSPRVAKARSMSIDQMHKLIAGHTTGRTFGVFGEPRVNVLTLNLALDKMAPQKAPVIIESQLRSATMGPTIEK